MAISTPCNSTRSRSQSWTGFCSWYIGGIVGLLLGPLLVTAATAVPELYCGAISSASASYVEAEAGVAADDGAVGVEVPLLIAAARVVGLAPAVLQLQAPAQFAHTVVTKLKINNAFQRRLISLNVMSIHHGTSQLST